MCLLRPPRSDPIPLDRTEQPGLRRVCVCARGLIILLWQRGINWCIQLVSLDGHKTLTPLIASKLRVSRVTARLPDSSKSGSFLSSSLTPSYSVLHIAHRDGRRDNHQRYRAPVQVEWPKEPERTREEDPSYFHPSFLPASRPDDLVLRQFPRGSFGFPRTLPSCRSRSSFLGDYLHFSIAIRAPWLRLVDRIWRSQSSIVLPTEHSYDFRELEGYPASFFICSWYFTMSQPKTSRNHDFFSESNGIMTWRIFKFACPV